jgi:hypothetical protein
MQDLYRVRVREGYAEWTNQRQRNKEPLRFHINPSISLHNHFSPEDGDIMLLRNVGIYLRVHTASRTTPLSSSPWEPQITHTYIKFCYLLCMFNLFSLTVETSCVCTLLAELALKLSGYAFRHCGKLHSYHFSFPFILTLLLIRWLALRWKNTGWDRCSTSHTGTLSEQIHNPVSQPLLFHNLSEPSVSNQTEQKGK